MDTPAQTSVKLRIDPVVTEIVRNGFVAITDEMKTNLMRTAYNMIIYEALDFTVGAVRRRGQHDLHRARPPDVHPRTSDAIKAKLNTSGRTGSSRANPAHKRLLHHGEPPEPHDLHPADLLGG